MNHQIQRLGLKWPIAILSTVSLTLLFSFQNCQKVKEDLVGELDKAHDELEAMIIAKEAFSLWGFVDLYASPADPASGKQLRRRLALENIMKQEGFDFKELKWVPEATSLDGIMVLGKNGWTPDDSEIKMTWDDKKLGTIKLSDGTEKATFKLVNYYSTSGIEMLSAIEEYSGDQEAFYNFKHLVVPKSEAEKVRGSDQSRIYQVQVKMNDMYSYRPQELCLKGKSDKCLTQLNQIISTRIRLHTNSNNPRYYEVEPQKNKTVKIYVAKNPSDYNGPFDIDAGVLGSWERRKINGVDLIIIKPPRVFLETRTSSLLLVTKIDGVLIKGDYFPEQERLVPLYNKNFTDDVAKMMATYSIAK